MFAATRRDKVLIMCLASFAGLAAMVFFTFDFGRHYSRLVEVQSSIVLKAVKLQRLIGYGGFIHDFKNAVLRPSEPVYRKDARRKLDDALVTLEELEQLSGDFGLTADFGDLRETLQVYSEKTDQLAELDPGLSSMERDRLVRIPDDEAIKDLAGFFSTLIQDISRKRAALYSERRWLTVITVLLAAMASGTLLYLYQDRVRQREQAGQIAHLNRKIQAVIDTAINGIVAVDEDGRVLLANPVARHMLGGISESPPFDWPDTIQFLDAETLAPLNEEADPLRRALNGEKLRDEVKIMTRGAKGLQRYVRISSANVSRGGLPIHTVVALSDISDMELRRQQVERSGRLEALGQLTGGIAHDFNNILATVQYAIQLSLRQGVPDATERVLNIGLKAATRGGQLTARLLSFAKRQPGRAESKLVSDVFVDAEHLLSTTIEANIELRIIAPDAPLYLYCDHAQLENALLNLVLNARDAILRTSKGSKITLEARAVSQAHFDNESFAAKGFDKERDEDQHRSDGKAFRYVEISVTDDGAGMSEEVKRRAIDPFFTTKGATLGTGLGLSIVYGFVQQAGGELRIYSEEGFGTTVRLLLPRGVAGDLREAPVAREAPEPGDGQTIMVVEDEPALLSMLTDVVESLGYQTQTAKNGAEALTKLESGTACDVLLTDVVMPGGVGGFELAQRLRSLRPEVPVIYMSGYTGFSDDEMGDVTGPMLFKPCSTIDLVFALKRAVSSAGESLEG